MPRTLPRRLTSPHEWRRRAAPRGRSVALAALALAGVLASGAPAQAIRAAPDSRSSTADVAVIVTLRDALFPRRLELLHSIRDIILARRDRAAITAVVAALDDGCRASQAELRRWLEQRGGTVTQQYWILPALAARIPASVATQLDSRPEVAAVHTDTPRAPHLKICTNAANHNADYVHNTLGQIGSGAVLALLDSGIEIDVDQAGTPHPAFDFRAPQTGTRIRQALGIANATDVEDENGHGSAVGAIAIATDWMGFLGLSDDGFAPGAEVISYKVTLGSSLTIQDAWVVAAWQRVLADTATHNIVVANHSYAGSPSPTFPSQQALDQAAFFGDILVVTSAGNDGQQPLPAAASQANASGIAVGWSIPDVGQATPHTVSPDSTFGPLPGDGARFFPDILASGEGVRSVTINSATGVSTNSGTSFSAPQVAGTALLIRSAAPSYTALDAKAVILNNVQDVSGFNPGLTRLHYGLGLLRTDLAADAVTNGTVLQGNLSVAGLTQQSFAVSVQAGKSYAATLVWPRTNSASFDWDDLDLHVVDTAGKTIAAADTPRNLYERALFTANSTGVYNLVVIGTSLTTPTQLPFSVAFSENFGGGRQSGSYKMFGAGCIGTAQDPAGGTVLPPVAAGAFGNANTRVPFSYLKTRLQQAYSGTTFPSPHTVQTLAFRRDEQQADSPGYDMSLEVAFGYTTLSPSSLSPTFANNINGAMTTVLPRTTVRFPGTQGLPANANQFDFAVPLAQPFTVATAGGLNLLLEMRVYSHTQGSQPFSLFFDAVQDPQSGRVYTDDQPNGTVGVVDDLAIVVSLMDGLQPPIAPNLQADGRPQLGETFSVVLRHALPQTAVVLAHGLSETVWSGAPLPLDLAPLGAPGCSAWIDAVFTLPLVTGTNGMAEIPYPVPLIPALTGETFYNQYWVLDPTANTFGLVVSNAARALVGG